jgi:hypothetical protein
MTVRASSVYERGGAAGYLIERQRATFGAERLFCKASRMAKASIRDLATRKTPLIPHDP